MKRFLSMHWFAVVLCLLILSVAWQPARASTPNQAPTFPTQGTGNANANLREGPATTYAKVGSIKAGDRVLLTGCNDDCTWYQLKAGQWIVADPVDITPTASTPQANVTPTQAGDFSLELGTRRCNSRAAASVPIIKTSRYISRCLPATWPCPG